jgi:capsular polysaccharide transport system ATP-binding protein
MITLRDVHKRYRTARGPRWVLKGLTFTFPPDKNVAVIGVNGAGKSTLIRLIGGIDTPTRGEIKRHSRVSWPLGLTGGLMPRLTGRQNARFICRIHGFERNLADRIEYVRDFSELGSAFDEPIWTYSSGMRARLSFSLSFAFEFEMYLVDEVIAVGDAAFRVKSRKAFDELATRAGLVLASHDESIIKSFCHAAVWLHKGQAHYFDSVTEALVLYNKSLAA